MSMSVNTQTAWEETEEEVVRRHQHALKDQESWIGTVIGLALAGAAAGALFLFNG